MRIEIRYSRNDEVESSAARLLASEIHMSDQFDSDKDELVIQEET